MKYEHVAIVARVPCGACRDEAPARRAHCPSCAGKGYREQQLLEDGEPFFLIRGKDAVAPLAVEMYRLLALDHWPDDRSTGAMMAFSASLGNKAREIVAWQQANPSLVKVPD